MRKLLAVASIVTLLVACGEPRRVDESIATSANANSVIGKVLDWPDSLDPTDSGPSGLSQDVLADNILLVLDGSGSMNDTCGNSRTPKIDEATDALSRFIQTVPDETNVGLVVFDRRGIDDVMPLSRKNSQRFLSELDRVRPGGGTPLGQSMDYAYDLMSQQGVRQLGYGNYMIVVVTDGEASDSGLLRNTISEIVDESPVLIQTVGFCIDEGHVLNQPGRTEYATAKNASEIVDTLASVLAESQDFTVSNFNQ